MSNLTDKSMDHLLYLPKQYLTPCQSQQLIKMRHILSHSWLNYNWKTKAAADDLHHHRSWQVERDDHTFISKNCMETKVHSTKTKLWASFYIPKRLRHSRRPTAGWEVALNFLILPCADSRVCPTEKLLFTGNVLILFFLQDIFAFLPAVICETHVGLAGRVLVGILYFHQHTPAMKQHLGVS